MDLHLKQWRNQHESEQQQHQQHSVKIPKLLLDPHQQASSALPLFVPEPNTKISNLSAAFPDSSTRYPRMGSYFSWAQWQELELQALIYRYMLAGAAVPPELLLPIKKSLPLHSHPYFLHHYPHNYQPALLQSGYWGRAAMDPEPGRCRRTDGKKWRCSRDVVAGQKYCERHMHRGRNRSRKPVEMPTPNGTSSSTNNNAAVAFGGGAAGPVGAASLAAVANGPNFGLSGPSPSIDLLHFNQSSSDSKTEHTGFFEAQVKVDDRNDGHILRHFFDDWPRSLQESENARNSANSMNSNTSLSISMPGNSSSDVSLKLSTGNGDEQQGPQDIEREQQPQLNWGAGWASNQVASMGGPLAEALRSSSNSSPTSVLHQLPRASASDTSYVST
ncbi:hypothetical protein SLEP1_g45552 [Rubroshorea leprosula]|uniref:Growth-regulating factor n=1 Tax=Rubroshorea leprosula TaxID=152421 RepID=A0AAV5LK72_9ROSI|nr:hypothetical protein SLEP1_g45552 [Rubroshorea leprosula]